MQQQEAKSLSLQVLSSSLSFTAPHGTDLRAFPASFLTSSLRNLPKNTMNSKSVVVSKCVAVLFLFTAQLIGVFGASDDIFDYNNPSRYGLDYLTRFPVLPQMTSPELNPLDGLHLPYLHPVTMFVEENKDTLPYDYVRVHYKICIYNHTECTDDSMIDRQLRSILPGETIGLRLDNVDDEGIGRNTLQMERPIKVTIASFASSGISWR